MSANSARPLCGWLSDAASVRGCADQVKSQRCRSPLPWERGLRVYPHPAQAMLEPQQRGAGVRVFLRLTLTGCGSGKEPALRLAPPLRTGLESFPSSGSSRAKALAVRGRCPCLGTGAKVRNVR